jgi:hypothetical protein
MNHDEAIRLLKIESQRMLAVSSLKQALDYAIAYMESKPTRVDCHHEPYHGKCIHCDVPFTRGKPEMQSEVVVTTYGHAVRPHTET